VSEFHQKRYSANFETCRNVQMPFPGACIRPMAVLNDDQVYKFTVLSLSVVVGLSCVYVTRDCVAYENCIVPNLDFPTGVYDLRSVSLNSSMKFNIASTSSHLPLSLSFH
jgi:hypothetical protein